MKRILFVEDDPNLGRALGEFLRSQGYETIHATDLKTATQTLVTTKLSSTRPELIVLDWNLPDGEGISWLRDLRARGDTTPIIVLTARVDIIDKVLGLEMGANDYITKPFEPRELLARIRVQLRGREQMTVSATALENSGVRLDLSSLEATYNGRAVSLTKMELGLLRFFLENPKRAVSREDLLRDVWNSKSPTTRTVDMHVLQLRQKFATELFETLHGIGYRFVPSPDRS